jgi:peptidoglycan/xylan/chitin deacetylase (PgdA/CDA1 family)
MRKRKEDRLLTLHLAMRFAHQHCMSHDRRRPETLRAMSVKAAALAAFTQDALLPMWRSLASDLVVVLMLHRFTDRDLDICGDSPAALRANLELLRKHRFDLAPLGELIGERDATPPKGPTVVFTVDDGYADFANIAAPIFAEFDCPVTVFVVTDVVAGKRWFWWDRVQFVIEASSRDDVDLELSTGRLRRPRLDGREAGATITTIVEALKRVPDAEKERALLALATHMGVDVPPAPPARFAAMTWDDVQRCARMGVTFGPHTVAHPMLTQVDSATATSEILDSWTQLRERCDSALPVFCYPNGAYTSEHVDILARSTMRAALSTEPGYAKRAMFASGDPATRFAIPRFSYAGNRDLFVQVVAGLERFKMEVRGAMARTGRPMRGD